MHRLPLLDAWQLTSLSHSHHTNLPAICNTVFPLLPFYFPASTYFVRDLLSAQYRSHYRFNMSFSFTTASSELITKTRELCEGGSNTQMTPLHLGLALSDETAADG